MYMIKGIIKSWLDYKEYLYYYKSVLVILVSVILESNIKNMIGTIIGGLFQFMGIKYWVFKNEWKDKKNLSKEILLFTLIQIMLFYLRPVFEYMKNLYKKVTLKGKSKSIMEEKILKFKKEIKEMVNDKMLNKIFYLLYIFLTTSVLGYPFYRYIIFTPKK